MNTSISSPYQRHSFSTSTSGGGGGGGNKKPMMVNELMDNDNTTTTNTNTTNKNNNKSSSSSNTPLSTTPRNNININNSTIGIGNGSTIGINSITINNKNNVINKNVVTSDRNTLKSDAFPMISSNWESNKYFDYISFRTYYANLKSRNFILFNLFILSLLFSAYYYLYLYFDFIKEFDNMFFYYYLPLSCTTFMTGYTIYNIHLHFKQVPEIQLSEDERVLYDWPNNFPTSPFSPLSPVKPVPSSIGITENNISTPKNKNVGDLSFISPIQKQQQPPQLQDQYISSYSSINQFKAQQQSSPTSPMNNSRLNSSFNYQQGQDKSFEELERDRLNFNFKGRLHSNLTDFSFEQHPFREDDKKKSRQQPTEEDGYLRQSLTNEYQSMSSLNNTTEPIHYNIVQKPITTNIDNSLINVNKPKTFQQTVEHKVLLWNRFIEDNHFYAISDCSTKCKRWFTMNILSQLVEPAQLFLSLREDTQQQLQEEHSKPFSKQLQQLQLQQQLQQSQLYQQQQSQLHQSSQQQLLQQQPLLQLSQDEITKLDEIKHILKNVTYNLNLINDVHHKKESIYICQRIIELSRDKHVFHDFNKGGENWIPNELPTDEQLLFCLFLAYMDSKLYRDVTAPNPDIPFSSKYIKHEDSKYINSYSAMISIVYKRPLHCDLLIPVASSNITPPQVCDISPGFDNLFFAIVLFFYNVIQYQNGYLEDFDVSLLNVKSFVQPLINSTLNSVNSDDDDDDNYNY
ncbi:hypothetical protein RB653_005973 [Dictyostelium firmibasis]|uniref:Transmembrane protein n=1 Tax=Dictyostelium firmibasis TaxID=79012 RepID=A0AAN7Z1N3_9MYCE